MSKYQDCRFVLEDDCIVKCKEAGKIVVLPATVDGHPVKRVGLDLGIKRSRGSYQYPENNALWPNDNEIEAVIVEDGVEELKTLWYIGLTNLKEVYLPASVKSIAKIPFGGVSESECRDLTIYVERDMIELVYNVLLYNSRKMENGRRLLLNTHLGILCGGGDYVHRSLIPQYRDKEYTINPQLGCMICEHIVYSDASDKFIWSDNPFDRDIDFYGFFDIGDIELVDPETKEFTADFIKKLIEREPMQLDDIAIESSIPKATIRGAKNKYLDPLAVTTFVSFDEREVLKTDDGYRVCLTYRRGLAGIPIIKPVAVNGKTYYVLYVYYLRVAEFLPLRKRPVGVYLENGQPASKTERALAMKQLK